MSVAFVAFLVFTFITITYRLKGADVAMIAALLTVPFEKGAIRIPAVLVWFGLFVLWCAVGYLQSPYPAVAGRGLVTLCKLWLIAFVAVNVLRSRPRIRLYLIWFLLLFATFPARGTVINYLTGSTIFGRSAWWTGVFGNPNDMAAFALLPLGIAAALLRNDPNRWVRCGALASLVVLPIVIFMTQSRGGVIALAILLLCALATPQFRGRRGRILGALAVIVAIAVVAGPSGVWSRMAGLDRAVETGSLLNADDSGSANQRFTIWKVALDISRAHPVFGIGTGAYPFANARSVSGNFQLSTAHGERDAHSMYLNVLAETGIGGLLLFAALLASVVRGAERARRRVRETDPVLAAELWWLESALFAYLVAGVFGTYTHLTFLYLHLALLSVISGQVSRAPVSKAREVRVPSTSRALMHPSFQRYGYERGGHRAN